MAKSSKSCGYTGRMHSLQKNSVHQADQTRPHAIHNANQVQHAKHQDAYPEVAAEHRARIESRCNCKK